MTTRVQEITAQKMQPHGAIFPLVRIPDEPTMTSAEMFSWMTNNRAEIRNDMQAHGAVLLRGFPINGPEDFERLLDAGEFKNMPYVGGAAPRAQVTASRVLTANESPPEEPIPFHHEMAKSPIHQTTFSSVATFRQKPAGKQRLCTRTQSTNAFDKLIQSTPQWLSGLGLSIDV